MVVPATIKSLELRNDVLMTMCDMLSRYIDDDWETAHRLVVEFSNTESEKLTDLCDQLSSSEHAQFVDVNKVAHHLISLILKTRG